MTAQKQLLRAGISTWCCSPAACRTPSSVRWVRAIQRAQLDIHPELYDLWIDALLETIGQHDEDLQQADLQAWRAVLNKGIDVIKAAY